MWSRSSSGADSSTFSRTERSARSSVALTGSPFLIWAQPRTAPSPSLSLKGRSTWRRNWLRSARGSSAYSSPLQCWNWPGRFSRLCVNRPRSVKRRPQSAGGVASRRSSWRRKPLRMMKFRSDNSSGRASARFSSTQRTRPPMTASSGWLNSQSRPASVVPVSVRSASSRPSPPMKMRPAASRRMTSSGASISICEKRGCSTTSEWADSTADTRGSVSAGRPFGSSTRTSASSMRGIQPPVCTVMLPMRSSIPKAFEASLSSQGRHSLACGRMAQCNTPQATTPRPHTRASASSAQRSARQHRRRGQRVARVQ
jgi:hypothetical protein